MPKKQRKNDGWHGRSWFMLPYRLKNLAKQEDADIRFPESFAEEMLRSFTKKGDVVLDPFAGFGTTLFVANAMGRVGIGIEITERKYEHIRKKLSAPSRIILGSARALTTYKIPMCDFSVTSPPYMQKHHRENPLTDYTKPGSYDAYLQELQDIYRQMKSVMKKDAAIVLEVSNIRESKRPMTPLAWDIARVLSEILFFERELIYCHEKVKPGSRTTAEHSYCLVFRNR